MLNCLMRGKVLNSGVEYAAGDGKVEGRLKYANIHGVSRTQDVESRLLTSS